MKNYQKELIKRIANEYNISIHTLENLISTAKKNTYENTTDGQRQNNYLEIIKFALSSNQSRDNL